MAKANALVTNSKDSLYGGVNLQAAEHRLPTQVKESINAHPTVNDGLLKRNPTSKLSLTDTIPYKDNMWVYAYDRGLAGDNEEKYSVHITDEGMFIVDTVNGTVFNELNDGLVFDNDEAKNYLAPFGGSIGYSAVTIKDTTFLLNKNVQPRMLFKSYAGDTTVQETKYVKKLNFSPNTSTVIDANLYAPYKFKKFEGHMENSNSPQPWHIDTFQQDKIGLEDINGNILTGVGNSLFYHTGFSGVSFTIYDIKPATTTITIDGKTASYTPPVTVEYDDAYETNNVRLSSLETFASWMTNIKLRIQEMLPSTDYNVIIDSNFDISIIRYDGLPIDAIVSITPDTTVFRSLPSNFISETETELVPVQADYSDGVTSSISNETVIVTNNTYDFQGFIWVKASNPTSAYSYNVTVTDNSGNTVTHNETASTTTETAATAIASAINANSNFNAIAVGSIVKITALTDTIASVETSDSYGNQASFGWAKEVGNYTELPKKLGFGESNVYIKGDISSQFKGYWLKYSNGSWGETIKPNIETVPLDCTMPHILVREFDAVTGDVLFTLKQWDGWVSRAIGDNDSNPLPSFMEDGSSIKDIFFFKNRLGFITPRNVVMSEVGVYGNFFRTTVTAVLDSDRIDTTVDTTKAIQLEYATYLEDSLILFSDKAQFKLEGGAILSPKSIQVSQTSAYEINKNIRPIFMNDKVFFCARRGDYTAVMQYHIFGDGRISEAVDITAHAEKYIPVDAKTLHGSSINNMLFISTGSSDDTIFVYKYLDSADERIQSAWFKWEYNGHVYNAFSLGKNLNILINRVQASAVSDGVLGSGIWDGSDTWTADGIWIGSPDDLTSSKNFEVQHIHPQDYKGYFVDASEFVEDTTVIENIVKTATSSTLVYNCNVQMINDITISLSNNLISAYVIEVGTSLGATYTATNGTLTLNRNAAEYVTSVTITINDADGTVFTGFNFSCIGSNTQLLYNTLFQNGVTDWTFTNWTINYGQKDIGSIIPVYVDLDEWVFKAGNVAQTRGTLKMKTCQINSEVDSDFELEVRDVQRDSIRQVKSRYTVNRKPMVYGDSRNIRLAITNNSEKGFRINSVSLEGNYNSRSRRV